MEMRWYADVPWKLGHSFFLYSTLSNEKPAPSHYLFLTTCPNLWLNFFDFRSSPTTYQEIDTPFSVESVRVKLRTKYSALRRAF